MMKTSSQCLFLSLLFGISSGSPAGTRSVPVSLSGDACQVLGRALLKNVFDALEIDQMFRGLNCTEQSAELRDSTRTLSACTPQNSQCLEGTDFTFDQDECLQSMLDDLRYYWATFKSFHSSDLVLEQSVLKGIENLMQRCFSDPLLDGAKLQISVDNENSFERRLKLCKVLKGFQIRTITINRVLNHIVSTSQTRSS